MSEQSKILMPKLFASMMYICGLFLFIEWLYPVEEITDTDSISIFVIYAVFCFFITIVQMKWWLNFLLKGFGLLFILNGLYFDMLFLSPAWFDQLFMELVINADVLLAQDWYYLTPFFRSFLFLLLIWLMSYLLHYWFVQMKRIFLFIILTFIYIAVLDTFTMYDANFAVIRTFIISLIALALANFSRDLEKENISFQWVKKAPTWLIPLVLTLMFSVVMGVALPKLDPQWPDPVPFIQSTAEQVTGGAGNRTVQKVGYGEDDSRLGGSFIQDDSPVFYAEAEDAHYWRIETRDVYTGKGWESSAEPDYSEQLASNFDLETFNSTVVTEERMAFLSFESGQTINRLVYPYGVKGITDTSSEVNYFLDRVTDAIEPRINGENISLERYTLMYNDPSISLTAMQNSTEEYLDMEHFTQLPDSLPTRVGELAKEITAPHDSRFDKVRAIERYFSSNDYTYQTEDVAVPGTDDDYVDQFLFETRVGYCDNFSTAMVVMLRSLDIPARWAKGFTSGEMIEASVYDDHDMYEVTNANAHSWVEVYFPETGWVSFEPTQGFSNPTDFHLDSAEAEEVEQDDVLDAPEPEMPESDAELEEEEAEAAIADASESTFDIKWWMIAIAAGIILVIATILYRQRYRLKTILYSIKLGYKKDEKAFENAYLHLLRILDHYGFDRKVDETLREYAKRIDIKYHSKDMQVLTDHYERMLYRKDFNQERMEQLTKFWKNLTNKIIG